MMTSADNRVNRSPTARSPDALLAVLAFIQSRCDLDLLFFLNRHPHTVLTSERLALMLGYELKRFAASLDRLIAAGVVNRTQSEVRSARVYALETRNSHGPELIELLQLSASRKGRLAILRALEARMQHTPRDKDQRGTSDE